MALPHRMHRTSPHQRALRAFVPVVVGILLELDLQRDQHQDHHGVERHIADQLDKVLCRHKTAQGLKGLRRHRDLLCCFRGLAHDRPLLGGEGQIAVPSRSPFNLFGMHADALGEGTVVDPLLGTLRQPPHGQNGSLPEDGIELGHMAQTHAELEIVSQQRRMMGHDAEDMIDAPEPLKNVITAFSLALGELL